MREDKILSPEYCAGLFDGEGTVYAANRQRPSGKRPSPTIMIFISNTNREIIDILQGDWGGSVWTRVHRDGGSQDQHQWALAPKMGYPFLKCIQPFVIIKRDVVAVALQLCELMRLPRAERIDYSHTIERGGRKWSSPIVRPEFHSKTMTLHAEIRRLNTRGAPFNATRQYDA